MSGGYIEGDGHILTRIDPTRERIVSRAEILSTPIYFETLLCMAADRYLAAEDDTAADCD